MAFSGRVARAFGGSRHAVVMTDRPPELHVEFRSTQR
jgi:hypothetical protein